MIEDPLEERRNVARSCFGIAQVQWLFSNKLTELEVRGTSEAQHENVDILRTVLLH